MCKKYLNIIYLIIRIQVPISFVNMDREYVDNEDNFVSIDYNKCIIDAQFAGCANNGLC